LLELGRQGGGRLEFRADGLEEPPEEDLRLLARRRGVERGPGGCEGVDHGISRRDLRRGRLDHGERGELVRPSGGCQQRDDASVGMPDEVVTRLDQAGHEDRVRLEVDALDVGVGCEPRTLQDDELEAIGQRALSRPGASPADDAAVDEDDSLHQPILPAQRL
jgi:hypothetical protein